MSWRARAVGVLVLACPWVITPADATVAASPSVALSGGGRVPAGTSLPFAAVTAARLSGAFGRYTLELRAIDLARTPRSPISRPDYRDPRRCTKQPCRWRVTRTVGTAYEFRAALIDWNGAAVTFSKPVRGVWTTGPQPHAFKLLVNGTSMRANSVGVDDYVGVRPGPLRIEARWLTDARRTGHHVVIGTTEPRTRTYVTCRSGTSCRVPVRVPIRRGQDMSWRIKVVKAKTGKVVAAYQVCLQGRG